MIVRKATTPTLLCYLAYLPLTRFGRDFKNNIKPSLDLEHKHPSTGVNRPTQQELD